MKELSNTIVVIVVAEFLIMLLLLSILQLRLWRVVNILCSESDLNGCDHKVVVCVPFLVRICPGVKDRRQPGLGY